MTAWTFHNPVHVVFEAGAIHNSTAYIGGQRIVIVTSPGFTRRGVVGRLRDALGSRVVAVQDDVQPNPDVEVIDAQADGLRQHDPDSIVALGGGSSIDSAKALARLLAQPPDKRLVSHFRDGVPMTDSRALPLFAIPTTAGTGAEVTPFGTVWDFSAGSKYSVTGTDLYATAAILDPELTHGLPRDVTIASGLDAVSHALESVWNHNASPVTLGFAGESLKRSLTALPVLLDRPDDPGARADMMQASLLAGLAISQTRTALGHSISYPLTTDFGLPHGIACSFTLPALLRFNGEADDGRLRELGRLLGHERVEGLARQLADLIDCLGVADIFRAHVGDPISVMGLSDRMFTPDRAGNNLRSPSLADVEHILAESVAPLKT